MRELLTSGVNVERNGQPIEDLGYTISLLGSQDALSLVQLSLQCDVTVPQLGGNCLLTAEPGTTPYTELTNNIVKLLDICRLIVNCWLPDDGVASCHSLAEAIEPRSLRFNSGWVVYRSVEHGPLPQLPGTARVERVNNQGYIVVASENITVPPKPKAIEDIRAVYEALGPALKLNHV